MKQDLHEIVTLMHDQLDALQQQVDATECHCHPHSLPVDDWIETTRRLLPPRGHRG
jgi:hypothetical protein